MCALWEATKKWLVCDISVVRAIRVIKVVEFSSVAGVIKFLGNMYLEYVKVSTIFGFFIRGFCVASCSFLFSKLITLISPTIQVPQISVTHPYSS